ncbi:3-hydroxyacyl-CoA dehydrogenase family protein [Pseudomonas sp. NPDC087598]|uniref:3-hydroxyacyl-CoA dehydrogenase family protein n=1 Tax=Pseudomonas sp. NPDC087598 TaxID=3364440 RepID=UPI00381DC1E5
MEIIGVIGAGTMGSGVAVNAALAGFRVIMVESDEGARKSAVEKLRTAFQLTTLLDRAKTEHVGTVQGLLEKIDIRHNLDSVERADIVFECATERRSVKQQIFQELDVVCGKETIFASNTSCIEIEVLAGFTSRPEQVLGVHFMNPASLRDFVEVTKGSRTTQATVDATVTVLKRLGKNCEVVNDSPGFVINRVLMLAINEAIGVVEEQVADCKQVDNLFEKCLGHKTGPLATADLIGLDVIADSLIVLKESLNNEIYEPKQLLKDKVSRGELGVKTKSGFYKY